MNTKQTTYALGHGDGKPTMVVTIDSQPLKEVKKVYKAFKLVAECPEGTSLDNCWFEAGKLCTHQSNPDTVPVTHDEMKEIWYRLEQAPVKVYGHWFDCKHEPDITRFNDSIEMWDIRPRNFWTTADTPNVDYPINSKEELVNLRRAVIEARAIRAEQLFIKKREFTELGGLLQRKHLIAAGWL